MCSKYKKLCNLPSFIVASEIRSALEGICKLYAEFYDSQIDSDGDDFDPSSLVNRQYLVPRISNQHIVSGELAGKDGKLSAYARSHNNGFSGKFLVNVLKHAAQ